MTKKLVIIGAGGHGKVIADIAKLNKYENIVFLDDNDKVTNCSNYKVVGKTDSFLNYQEYDFIVAMGNSDLRKKIQEKLISNNINVVTLIHPNAVIAEDVKIGVGTVVMAGVVVNSGTIIGNGCIINTASSVDHDNIIADYVHISVGSHLSGTVSVDESTWVGAGAIIKNNISICSNCMIGAGAVVVKDISKSGTYIGVPARKAK